METIKKEKFLTINQEYFNTSFLYLDLDSYFNSNEQFINITYRSPTVYLEGLMLEMPWMKFNKSYFSETNEQGEEINKKFIEFDFNQDSDDKIYVFQNVLEYLDKYIYSFLLNKSNLLMNKENNKSYTNIYSKNLKKIMSNNDEDSNICFRIKFENNTFIKDVNKKLSINFEDLNPDNTIIKCWIYSDGLWKYNNKFGMSWKIKQIKINKTNIDSTKLGLSYFHFREEDNNEEIEDEEEIEQGGAIPNFELETDPQFL